MVPHLVAANKIWLVQHVRVILDGALERVLASTRVSVENVAPEICSTHCVTTVHVQHANNFQRLDKYIFL